MYKRKNKAEIQMKASRKMAIDRRTFLKKIFEWLLPQADSEDWEKNGRMKKIFGEYSCCCFHFHFP